MRRDLLVITPSRGRPERLAAMLDACLSLSGAGTDVAVGVDTDDPALAAYRELESRWEDRIFWWYGARRSLAGWTNAIASNHAGEYRAYASLGDDHLPRTEGWDKALLGAIDGMGGTGISYGDDLLMGGNLCTAPVVSCDIVDALGWLALPVISHYCLDNAIKDIGEGAGCLAYCPDVITEHVHYANGKAPVDATYADAGGFTQDHPDWHAYQQWRQEGMAADVATVKALMA